MEDKSLEVPVQEDEKEPEVEPPEVERQSYCFDLLTELDSFGVNSSNLNQSNRDDVMKKYLVYMELPKIRIGEYRKSSCVSGNMIRFHFLLRIARDEATTVLRLLPIKAYKAPVVNFAVIHRPFLDDEEANGPIPKSSNVRSPLIRYRNESHSEEEQNEVQRPSQTSRDLAPVQIKTQRQSQTSRDLSTEQTTVRRPSQTSRDLSTEQTTVRRPSQTSRDLSTEQTPTRRPSETSRDFATGQNEARRPSQTSRDLSTEQTPARRPSDTSRDFATRQNEARHPSHTSRDLDNEQGTARHPSHTSRDLDNEQRTARRPSQTSRDQTIEQIGIRRPSQTSRDSHRSSPKEVRFSPKQKTQHENEEAEKQFEVESPTYEKFSPAPILSDDLMTSPAHPSKLNRPKKYFVYCEIPKILIGDYRNSSVVCSEIIHAHFLMKIAKNEEYGQPQLQPIRRYHKPKVNFAVIHRSLIVDNDAIGPIPRSPNVKSPMIKEDEVLVQQAPRMFSGDHIVHAIMGFRYGGMPRSKYELVTKWTLENGKNGVPYPALELSKWEA